MITPLYNSCINTHTPEITIHRNKYHTNNTQQTTDTTHNTQTHTHKHKHKHKHNQSKMSQSTTPVSPPSATKKPTKSRPTKSLPTTSLFNFTKKSAPAKSAPNTLRKLSTLSSLSTISVAKVKLQNNICHIAAFSKTARTGRLLFDRPNSFSSFPNTKTTYAAQTRPQPLPTPTHPPYIRLPCVESLGTPSLETRTASQLYNHFITVLKTPHPGLVLSVTGDAAGSLQLVPVVRERLYKVGARGEARGARGEARTRVQRSLTLLTLRNQAIAELVSTTEAWVITGGSDGGVMKMMGGIR